METTAQLYWYQDPVTWAAIVTAFATVAYVFISILLWRATKHSSETTRRIFEAANRPYLGTETCSIEQKDSSIRITTVIKNYGSVPARSIQVAGLPVYDADSKLIGTEMSQSHFLMPNARVAMDVIIPGEISLFILKGQTAMRMTLKVSYKSVTEQSYYYQEEYNYDSKRNELDLERSEGD